MFPMVSIKLLALAKEVHVNVQRVLDYYKEVNSNYRNILYIHTGLYAQCG